MNSQMTIGTNIALLAGLLVVFTIGVGGVALVSMSRMDTATQSILGDALPGIYIIDRAESAGKDVRGAMMTHIVSDNQEEMAQLESAIAQSQQKVKQILQDYEKTITRARDRELFERINPALDRFIAAWEKPRALSRAMKTQQALAVFLSETLLTLNEFLKAVSDEVEFNKASADEFAQQAKSATSAGRFWTWTILLLATVCGGGLGYVIVHGMNRVLSQSISELGEVAGQLASAAAQVSGASQSLAQGTSEQAASLQETSASTEEINSMARKNTETSRSAADPVAGSQQKVSANPAQEQTVAAMGDSNAQSGKTSNLIKVIDEIAFQTNILALNAAVEAARAGEAGMGIAVVADEVRNLAQRCAQAARDTAELIEESITKSNDGKSKVDQVADAIRVIIEDSGKVRTLVDEVNLGSQEQARGIEQISGAILQMEQVTQKSAANAEECASAAEELNAQSETLQEIVVRLAGMVHGAGAGDRRYSGAVRKPAAAAQYSAAARRHPESSSGLTALGAAAARPSHTTVAEPALAPVAGDGKDVLPLEAEFKEF